MLRIYFMQQWYNLSDPGMEDSLYDVESMRRFAGVGLDAIPAETTICKFRHLPMMDDCLHGAEQVIYGDKAYVDAQRQEEAQAEGVAWRVLRKAKRGLPWPMYTERVEN